VGYDGTNYHGYAAQGPRADGTAVPTIQSELERALEELYKGPVPTRAASRTDAGVHALGQLVSFDPPFRIPLPGMLRGLGSKLSRHVVAIAAWEELGQPDVRRDNLGKHYRYRVRCTEVADPLGSRYEWHLARRLDLDAMREAAERFRGTHDFGSFRAASCQARTTERTIDSVEIEAETASIGPPGDVGRLDDAGRSRGPHGITVHVRGQAFLHNMVRIMVGTLVDVGLSRRPPSDIDALLRQADRTRAGITAPAQGLTLVEVRWPSGQGGV